MAPRLILLDWLNRDGTRAGVTAWRDERQGLGSHVLHDIEDGPDHDRRLAAVIAHQTANGATLEDWRGQLQPRRWGSGWLCRYPGEADAAEFPAAGDALEAAARRWILAQAGEVVQLMDGPEVQHLVPGVAPTPLLARQIAQETARRAARRGEAPLPLGGLWDETARLQQDLF